MAIDVHWTAYVSALALPTIAGIAARVAYQQSKAASRQAELAGKKLRLDLFDKRFAAYTEMHECSRRVLDERKFTPEDMAVFVQCHKHAKWLFSLGVANHIRHTLHPAALKYAACWSSGFMADSTPEDRREARKKLKAAFKEARIGYTDLISPFMQLLH